VSLIYLLIERDYKEIKRMKLLTGIPLFLAIVLAWYVPAILSGGKAYLEENLFRHTTRAYSTGWTHPQPIYYYLYNFPMSFMPWTFFLPAAIIYHFSKTTIANKKGFLFPLIWCTVIFTFFSLSKSKRALYLLPLLPAASLMVGKFWADFVSLRLDPFKRGWISFPLYGFIGFGLIAGIATPWVVSIKFPSFLPYSLPIALLLVGCSAGILILYRLKNYRAVLFLLIGMMVAGYFYAFRVIFPLVNPQMSARLISEEITSRIQPGDKLVVYKGLGIDPYNYYTGVVPIVLLDNRETFLDFLGSSERVFCLLKFRDLSQLISSEWVGKVHVIARRRIRNDDVVLISNRQFSN
jgi:4-amino-4-deoxy-L-arabinose transferase-like glycosyltransferase